MKTIAIVPAFNEARRIYVTVKALEKIEILDKIFVVDDGSVDNTGEEAKRAGAEIIHLTKNFGKGRALNYALEKIDYFDILLLVDADLEESAVQAKSLLDAVLEGEADMAIADFPEPKKKRWFWFG